MVGTHANPSSDVIVVSFNNTQPERSVIGTHIVWQWQIFDYDVFRPLYTHRMAGIHANSSSSSLDLSGVPWLVCMCAMIDSYVCQYSLICVPWLIRMCPYCFGRVRCTMTYACVCHNSFICVSWLIHLCAMTHFCSGVPWPMRMCAMTHWYVCRDSLICVPWLIHMYTPLFETFQYDVTQSYQYHDSFIFVPRPIQMCAMTMHTLDMTQSRTHWTWLIQTWLMYM